MPRRSIVLGAVEPERLRRVAPSLNCSGSTPMNDQVRAVDALEVAHDDRLHAEQLRCPSPPSRASEPCAVLLAAEDDRAARPPACSASPRRRSTSARRDGWWIVIAAFGAGHHQVLDAHVGERAAHHDLVVAAARAVGVEVGDGDAVLLQVLAGRRGRLDAPAGLMWSVVIESPKMPSTRAPLTSPTLARLHAEALEVRRLGACRWSVVATCRPAPTAAGISSHSGLPSVNAENDLLEHLGVGRVLHDSRDLLAASARCRAR